MGRIFDTMDLDYIETINLEVAAHHCLRYIRQNINLEEAIAKGVEEEGKNEQFSISPERDTRYNQNSIVRNTEFFESITTNNPPIDKASQDYFVASESPLNKKKSNLDYTYQPKKESSRDNDFRLKKVHSNDIGQELQKSLIEPEIERNYSISLMRQKSHTIKTESLKELQRKFEMSKFLLKTMLNAIFFTSKYLPTIVRIFLKIVGQRYEKYAKVNGKFYKKSKDKEELNEKSRIKHEVHRLQVDVLASKWLVYSLFVNPDQSGLIVNRPLDKLRDTFVKFSKIFVYSLRGNQPYNTEESFIVLFKNFMGQHAKNSRNFMRSVVNINIDHYLPREDKTKYNNESILDVYCISEYMSQSIMPQFFKSKDMEESENLILDEAVGKYLKTSNLFLNYL